MGSSPMQLTTYPRGFVVMMTDFIRVRVSLPVIEESEEQRKESDRCQEDLKGGQEDASKLKFEGLDVLLVEDNLVNQKVGKRTLHTLGCNVTVCPKQMRETTLPSIAHCSPLPGRWSRMESSASGC